MITTSVTTTSMMQTCHYTNLTLSSQEHVNKCVNEKLFPHCKILWNNQDIDLFMALVFDEIGMNGKRPDDRYKQMTSWGAIRQMLKKEK